MPTPSTATWPKPRSEDEFEDIVIDFLRVRWKDPNAQRYGRRGQRQHGVDVLGKPHWLGGRSAAGQCKNVGTLRLADITAEVAKAQTFPGGPLAEFYVVTSADRDAALQSQVRTHFGANPAPFHVEVIFWPDIVADISGDSSLVAKHWHGFPAQSGAHSPSLAPPRWIDRDGVSANETTECHCEFSLCLVGANQLDATELRAELHKAVNESPTDYVARSLFEKQPSITGSVLSWSGSHRPYGNVIDKWAIEIGDGGHMVRRWSQFSTLPLVQFESYDLLEHVVRPLTKYAQAIAGWSTSVGAKNSSRQLLMRLAVRATKPPQLDDKIRLIEVSPRFARQVSPEEWQAELQDDLAIGAPRLAMRLLNRALGRFVEEPSPWLGPNQQPQLVRIDEAAYKACLAKAGL